MIIRKLRKSDKVELFRLFVEFENYYQSQKVFSEVTHEVEKYIDTKKAMMRFANKYINNKKVIAYVAERDNKLIGFIVGDIRKHPTKVLNKEGFIEELFVSNDFRKQKIGKTLFDTLVKEFKKQGCTHLGLDSFSDNKTTIDIYHKLGFQDYAITMKKLI